MTLIYTRSRKCGPQSSEYPAARRRTPRERAFIVAVVRGGAPTTKRATFIAPTLSMFSAISLTIPEKRVKVNPFVGKIDEGTFLQKTYAVSIA